MISASGSGKKILLLILIFLVVLGVGFGGFFAYKKVYLTPKNESVEQKVASLIELSGESPEQKTTVTKAQNYRNDKFFAHAENGDIVLIYPQNQKAILFRPSINKIVEVAYYNPAAVSLTPSAATQKVRVAIYNGTKTDGLAKTQAVSLVQKHPNLVVNDTENASGDYSKTVVIDVTGKSGELVKSLARELDGEVKNLPSVEARPEADILIILGE